MIKVETTTDILIFPLPPIVILSYNLEFRKKFLFYLLLVMASMKRKKLTNSKKVIISYNQ
jgi:hypothetical protein